MSIRKVKIRVGNPEQSRAVQEFLFKGGCQWRSGGDGERTPQYKNKPFLYVDDYGYISYSDGETFFTGGEVGNYRELKFNFETVTTVRATPQRQETTVLFGKIYDKDELQAALAKLTPIE